jgi:V-type H+-transporting ATPase subunit a
MALMGFFSIYVGMIYNDTFGTASPIFNSGWHCEPKIGNVTRQCPGLKSKAECCPTGVYPIGFDPIWALSDNKLNFVNSFKMKMSIVLGVTQMTMGTFCKLANALHFKQMKDIWFEFLPELVFMQSTFGYLVFLIIYKWSVDWVDLGKPAPSLLDTLIGMFMGLGAPPTMHVMGPDGKDQTVSMELYSGQHTVQAMLLLMAFLSVPMLLIPKPCLIYQEEYKDKTYKKIDGDAEGNQEEAEEGGHDFSEVVVHQIIHTIEYVLGAVSNTASYLRLWALSLAHSELSEVFLTKTLLPTLDIGGVKGILATFCGFTAWLCCTMGVLMLMESLSASLHALRLHWVEFQNKFFAGDGKIFVPFCFEELNDDDDDEA